MDYNISRAVAVVRSLLWIIRIDILFNASQVRDQWHHTLHLLYPLSRRYICPAAQHRPALREHSKSGIPTFSMTQRGVKTCESTSGMLLCEYHSIGIYQMAISVCWSSFTGVHLCDFTTHYPVQEGEILSLFLILSIIRPLHDSCYEVRVAFYAMALIDPVNGLLLGWII